MARARKGWDQLSPAYRKRLEKSGINKKTYKAGADLRAARGKKNEGVQKTAKSQTALTRKAVRAQATPAEIRELERMITRPSWLPKGFPIRTEVAAVMATLPNPRTWKHTYLTPANNGQPWTLTIYRTRAKYPIVVEIPGGGGAEGEAPREVIDILKTLNIQYNAEEEINYEDVFWTVMDTDMKAPKK